MKWPMYPLERIAEVAGGSTPKRSRSEYWDGNIPWVTPTDLPMPGSGIAEVYDTVNHITERGLRSCAAKLLPVGTVLYSSRATIGKIGIARVPLATNQGFANFTPKPGIESKYLAYALLYFTPEIASLAGSTTFKEVRRGALKKYKLPLPPLSEQRRIVEILDQADALRKKRAEADAKAARILPALFYKMFGDPLALMRDRNSIPLGQFDIDLQNGFACGQKDVEDGVPHLRMNNIDDAGVLNLDLIRTVPPEKDDRRYRLQGGDVLFMGTNSEDKIGKTCVFFPPDGRHYLFSNHLIRIRISDSRLSPEFLATYLHLLWVKSFYPSIAKRWVNQATVAQAALAKVRVPVPHKQSLKDFNQAFSELLLSRDKGIQSAERVNDLFDVLLHRAFTGDLTAQWREAHMKELLEEMEQQAKALETQSGESNPAEIRPKRRVRRRSRRSKETRR